MRLEGCVRQSPRHPASCKGPAPRSRSAPLTSKASSTSPPKPTLNSSKYNFPPSNGKSASDEEEKRNFIDSFGALSINVKKEEERTSSEDNDDSDSDDEKEIGEEFVAKCPDKETKTIKQHRKNNQPYKAIERIHNHQDVKGVNKKDYFNDISNIASVNDPFIECTLNECDELIKEVTQEQLDKIYQLLDKVEEEGSQVNISSSFTTTAISPKGQLNINTNQVQVAGQCSGEDSDEGPSFYQAPGSVDSAYFTTSPGSSVTYSPKQRQRLPSESSETSPHYEYPSYYNIQMQPREYVTIKQDGVPIHEKDMEIKAVLRIEPKLKNPLLEIQWVINLDKNFSSINRNTQLMLHLQIPVDTKGFLEKLYVIIELIRKSGMLDLLLKKNRFDQNALSFAAVNCADDARVARYILDTMVDLGHSFENEADSQGNTLLHILAKLGDSHAYVMAEFLNAKYSTGGKVLRIDAVNISHETPLHVGVKSHSVQTPTVSIVRLLVKHNADVKLTDSKGQSPLHLAVNGTCDPCLVKSILQSPFEMVNIIDPNGDSPLHCAARRDDIPITIQKEVIRRLLISGAKMTLNKKGEVPWSLVPAVRKNELKEVFNK